MSALDTFLKTNDLDDLIRARHDISTLTSDESAQVESIIRDWIDPQAVSNLLFYSSLIPADSRFQAIDRGLHSYDAPYFALAATVGLQGIKPDEVPQDRRDEWIRLLLVLVQSESYVLAGRASVTIFSWLTESEPADLLSLYPVPDETASKNIVAYGIARFGDLPAAEFVQRLSQSGVPDAAITVFEDAYQEYHQRKSNGEPVAELVKCPLLCYIPNMSDVSSESEIKHNPWWKFW